MDRERDDSGRKNEKDRKGQREGGKVREKDRK